MGTPMRDRGTGEPILDEDGSPQNWLGSQASDWLWDECFPGHARQNRIFTRSQIAGKV